MSSKFKQKLQSLFPKQSRASSVKAAGYFRTAAFSENGSKRLQCEPQI